MEFLLIYFLLILIVWAGYSMGGIVGLIVVVIIICVVGLLANALLEDSC